MKRRYGLGLFIGRFQPFHKGHLYALRFALARCSRLAIGIGSSQESGTYDNPLSSESRVRIIKSALKGAGIDAGRLRFVGIPDFWDDDAWFGYVMKKCPGIDVVFSRNRLVGSIFRSRGISVIAPPWHQRGKLAAARIRERIKEGRRWEDRVPEGAVGEIAAHEDEIRKSKGAGRPKIR